MVIAGVVHYSSVAFAADIQVSQNAQFAIQNSASQQTDTDQAIANPTTGSEPSVQSNNDAQGNTHAQADTNSSAKQEQMVSTTQASTEKAGTQLGELDTDLVSNSMQSFSGSATRSISAIATNSVLTVSQIQFPAMHDAERSEPMNDSEPVQQTMPSEMPDTPEHSNAFTLDNTTDIANSLSANVEQLASLDVTSQASQVIEQSVNTTVANSITGNAESSVLQTMNSQIDTLVAEQINVEVASATATEVTNTINSDLDLGI